MAGEAAQFAAGAGAAKAAGGELADILARLASATVDANGKLRDTAGRFVSMADQAKAAATATGAAAEALAKVAPEAKKADDAMRGAATSAKAGADGAKVLGDSALQMGQSATSAGGLVGKLQSVLSKLGPEGAAAAAALGIATIAVTALSAAILGGMATAIGVVERMTAKLATFSALGGSAAAGKATLDMVGRLSERLPFTTDQLTQWATAMQRAGYQGKSLETAVKAIAAAAALNPEGGANAAEQALAKLNGEGQGAAKFLKSIQQEAGKGEKSLREMGLSVADLGGKAAVAKMTAGQMAKAIEAALVRKGANPLAALGNTWEVIASKAKAGMMGIFSGLSGAVEPFMSAVKNLFAMFNRGGPMVAILKPVVTSVFSTLFSWATRAVNFVHSAFQQIVIAGLKVRIGVQPIVVAFRMLSAEVSKAIASTGLFQGKSTALATVLGFLKTMLVGTFMTGVTLIVGFIRVIAGMATAANLIITKVRALFAGLSLPSLAGAAGNMVSSFISGILSRIGAVMAAMTSMGAAAKKGLLGALGIASPSRVALEAAGNVTGTFAEKVDDGKVKTQAAFAGLVKPPPAATGTGGGSKGGSGDRLAAALERIATALEMSPGMREMIQMALLEASQENA